MAPGGGLDGWHPVGVFGVLIALAVSPLAGLAFGVGAASAVRLMLRRGTRRLGGPVQAGEWVMSAALSFSHGANDAQKAMGVTVTLLVAGGPPRHAVRSALGQGRLGCGADARHGVGAPVSTTHVVASSVIGVGVGRRRWRHVRRAVVRTMGFAWLATLPVAAALGAVIGLVWDGVA